MHASILNLYKSLGLFIECCSWISNEEPSTGAEGLPLLSGERFQTEASYHFCGTHELKVCLEFRKGPGYLNHGLDVDLTVFFSSYESPTVSKSILRLDCKFDFEEEDRVDWYVSDELGISDALETLRLLNVPENILKSILLFDEEDQSCSHKSVRRLVKAIVKALNS